MATKQYNFSVVSSGGGGTTYDWWADNAAFPAGSWKAICTTPDRQIQSVLPPIYPRDQANDYTSSVNITYAWNGGTVDQTAGELIFCGNGGDADYCGNEVYALSLKQQATNLRWRRIGDTSPNSAIVGTGTLSQDYYTDGGRKSNHNAYETHYHNGRVWAYGSSSCWARKTGDALWSWNKTIGATGATGGSLTGTEASNKPWTKYAATVPAGGYNFCAAALDETTGRIWKMGQYYMSTYRYCDTNSPNTASVIFNKPSTNFLVGYYGAMDSASIIAADLRSWFLLGDRDDPNGAYRIGIIDVSNGNQIGVVNSSWPGAPMPKFPGRGSLMYLNGSLYFCCPWQTGGIVAKLTIPTTGTGTAKRPDINGSWVWTTLSNNGTPPPIVQGVNAGTMTKCNMIRDMGDGRAAIVTCDQIDAPSYVYKLP